ncbi:hypothetical protein ACUSIJ_26980 [Pseudochelatococcus sp. B33]
MIMDTDGRWLLECTSIASVPPCFGELAVNTGSVEMQAIAAMMPWILLAVTAGVPPPACAVVSGPRAARKPRRAANAGRRRGDLSGMAG